MYYISVLVADSSYHGSEALTYGFDTSLAVGTLVYAPLRNKRVLGVVTNSSTTEPKFAVKLLTTEKNIQPIPEELLKLSLWMQKYYAASLGVVTQHILPKDLPKKPMAVLLNPSKSLVDLPPLTPDQQLVLDKIEPTGLNLLHGDTGTGKTRIYIELARKSLQQGKSALIITPEIGLTSQLATNFEQVFPGRIITLHSQLTEATRKRLWLALNQEKQPLVVIGARSALFSPLHQLGLVVIDESHETAYKQDKSPYYHASMVGAKLASLHKATFVLGSATPLITDYYIARQKKRPILRMTTTAAKTEETQRHIEIVDLKDREKFSKKSPLSDLLIKRIREALIKKEQILLFLNRRGTARIIMCDNCGWQYACPHCDLPLVYHGDAHLVRCHSCNFSANPPTKCSECNNTNIVFKSIGTKAVADEAARLFPEAKVMRFDTDNKKDERVEQHYQDLRDGKVDILVGTQTLAKGLDLPNLSVVGVVMADASLAVPDFSSQERTFQLLSQVIGRVGRGHRNSNVVIQTYSPGGKLIKAVVDNNWRSYYDNEIAERAQFLFPPFCFLLKVWTRRSSQTAAQEACKKLAITLRKRNPLIVIEGPAPSFHEKVGDKYQWQLIIKAKQRSQLLEIINKLPSGWSHDIDPMNLL